MKRIPGIYKITCLINGKIYIGSTVNLYKRRALHFFHLRMNKHQNLILQNAFNKYGIENFLFEVIEYIEDKTKLIEREQYYFDTLQPAFNIQKIAGSRRTLGFPLKNTEKGEIVIDQIRESLKQTRINHPEIIERQKEAYKQALINDPTIVKRQVEAHKKTLADNPGIMEKKTISLKQTLVDNPEIKINATKKLKETLANDPSIAERMSVKLKITLSKRPLLTCPHCCYQSKNKSNMTRFHFDNCTPEKVEDAKLNRERKEKLAQDKKNGLLIQCPYCEVGSNSQSSMTRFHFDNCKNKYEK